jgi:DNA polymerase III delta prime subunit
MFGKRMLPILMSLITIVKEHKRKLTHTGENHINDYKKRFSKISFGMPQGTGKSTAIEKLIRYLINVEQKNLLLVTEGQMTGVYKVRLKDIAPAPPRLFIASPADTEAYAGQPIQYVIFDHIRDKSEINNIIDICGNEDTIYIDIFY